MTTFGCRARIMSRTSRNAPASPFVLAMIFGAAHENASMLPLRLQPSEAVALTRRMIPIQLVRQEEDAKSVSGGGQTRAERGCPALARFRSRAISRQEGWVSLGRQVMRIPRLANALPAGR